MRRRGGPPGAELSHGPKIKRLSDHSHGGQVITQAAAGNDAVRALVFVSAFALARGESALALTGQCWLRSWDSRPG